MTRANLPYPSNSSLFPFIHQAAGHLDDYWPSPRADWTAGQRVRDKVDNKTVHSSFLAYFLNFRGKVKDLDFLSVSDGICWNFQTNDSLKQPLRYKFRLFKLFQPAFRCPEWYFLDPWRSPRRYPCSFRALHLLLLFCLLCFYKNPVGPNYGSKEEHSSLSRLSPQLMLK